MSRHDEGSIGDFANGAVVGAGGCLGDAVFSIVIPPSLDGALGELAVLAHFVREDHLANGLVAGCGLPWRTLGVFEGSENPHFEIVGCAFHVTGGRCVVGGAGADCHVVLP